MGLGGGTSGSKAPSEERKVVLTMKRKWLKRRETWLVLLGFVLHAVYLLSIFDIYFKTPIVHGMDPVIPRFNPPAKRLILIVGTLLCTPLVCSFVSRNVTTDSFTLFNFLV